MSNLYSMVTTLRKSRVPENFFLATRYEVEYDDEKAMKIKEAYKNLARMLGDLQIYDLSEMTEEKHNG